MVVTQNIDDFEKTRDKVVDMALAAFVVIGLVTLAASLYRITVIGWQPVMAVHVVIWIAVVGVFLFRRRLVFQVRAWFLIGVLIALGIGGLLTFGLVSVSIVAFLVASVLATILFGFGPVDFMPPTPVAHEFAVAALDQVIFDEKVGERLVGNQMLDANTIALARLTDRRLPVPAGPIGALGQPDAGRLKAENAMA